MLALCLSLYVSFGRGDVYELLLQLSDADSNSAYITAAGPVQSYNIIDGASPPAGSFAIVILLVLTACLCRVRLRLRPTM